MIREKLNAAFFSLAAGVFVTCNLFAGSGEKPGPAFTGMVLDLGGTSHYVKITPEYSNAALLAVLPYFSSVAEKLDLPVQKPITLADISQSHVLPFRSLTVSIMLKSGWAFSYSMGYVNLVANSHAYSALQDPDQIPRFYGRVNVTKDEAVQIARDTLKKLGIPLEDVFAGQSPVVTLPVKVDTNTVPHYEVEWLDPRSGHHCVDIHINGTTKQVERVSLLNKSLERSPPNINVPVVSAPDWPSVNPDYARRLIPIIFSAIGSYAEKLSLPVPLPLTTNNVARIEIHDNGGWPHAEIELTNGWRFIYRHAMVNGYYAPDNFFSSDNRIIHIKEFEGKWNLTTNQAIKVVDKTMAKLNYPTNNVHMDFSPGVYTAAVDQEHIPRLRLEWYYSIGDELQSKVEAEVNTDTGKLESLYYDDKAYWGSRPFINVPISVKR